MRNKCAEQRGGGGGESLRDFLSIRPRKTEAEDERKWDGVKRWDESRHNRKEEYKLNLYRVRRWCIQILSHKLPPHSLFLHNLRSKVWKHEKSIYLHGYLSSDIGEELHHGTLVLVYIFNIDYNRTFHSIGVHSSKKAEISTVGKTLISGHIWSLQQQWCQQLQVCQCLSKWTELTAHLVSDC